MDDRDSGLDILAITIFVLLCGIQVHILSMTAVSIVGIIATLVEYTAIFYIFIEDTIVDYCLGDR